VNAPTSNGDLVWRSRLLLTTTRLRELFLLPTVRTVLAQDALAAQVEPLLRTPDLLRNEPILLREWAEARPDAAALARTAGSRMEKECAGWPDDARRYRVLLRLATYRRLEAASLGSEVRERCPWWLGETSWTTTLADGLPFSIGAPRIANYYPNQIDEKVSLARLQRPEIVDEAERALFALVAAPAFPTAFAAWRELEPLRRFEEQQSLPLFPRCAPWPGGKPPPGYQWRVQLEELGPLGLDVSALILAGIAPYAAPAWLEYCRRHPDQIARWNLISDQLAVAHVQQHLRDAVVRAA